MNVEHIEREPRLSQYEREAEAEADALWKHEEWKAGCLRRACVEIRALGKDFDASAFAQVLNTCAASLYESSLPEMAEQADVLACEVEP